MPQGKKVRLTQWISRLESIIREEFGTDVPYDDELAQNFWTNGYGPRDFFKEHVVPEQEPEAFDIREL